MPKRTRIAYVNYINGLEMRNILSGTLGKACRRLAGITQGDPLSMLIMALVMQAWIKQGGILG